MVKAVKMSVGVSGKELVYSNFACGIKFCVRLDLKLSLASGVCCLLDLTRALHVKIVRCFLSASSGLLKAVGEASPSDVLSGQVNGTSRCLTNFWRSLSQIGLTLQGALGHRASSSPPPPPPLSTSTTTTWSTQQTHV